ncbi:hypothetical protein CG394_02430 [Gardnerella vaginalis]|nr:hypothetical protein CG394_02430 [Gardnerella vaginalis]TCH81451.1 hypothetical protein E0E48_00885 [Gardnerella vaginalis]TCH82622.1 hypothetical protein E0E46_00880 [Gardnerella vaginalis ATCC 14018 = JCM 11026]
MNNILGKSLARYSARTSSPHRSSASALSGSALRITFSRYALSEKAGRRALKISQLGHHLINANISVVNISRRINNNRKG